MQSRYFRRFMLFVAILTLLTGFASPQTLAAQGTMIADSGFRPSANGLPFENYGAGLTNLLPEDVQSIFGDSVCGSTANGKCILTPPAQEWMETMNKEMDGGHCYGFSDLALLVFKGGLDVSKFGGSAINALKLQGNDALQRELAVRWSAQAFQPVTEKAISGSPAKILAFLAGVFKQGKDAPEMYTLGIFKPGFQDGHAITPYAVEDRGNNTAALLVYDNNWPGQQREVLFDLSKDSWRYSAATNPNEPEGLYEGDATTNTLDISPLTPGLGKQPCPFCGQSSSRAFGVAMLAETVTYNMISLESDTDDQAHLLLTDASGHNTGYLNGKFVNEIPNVKVEHLVSGNLFEDSSEPVYYVPTTIPVKVTLDGSGMKAASKSTVYLIGPGYTTFIDNITLDPGQKDTINFSADGRSISYTTQSGESPDLVLGVENPGADYEFTVKGVALGKGGTINLSLDSQKNQLVIGAKIGQAGTFSYVMNRIDDKGVEIFEDDGIVLEPSEIIYVDYSKWDGTPAGTVDVLIDKGDGKPQPGPSFKNEKR